MTALDQAQAEAGYVIDLSGPWLAAIALLLAAAWVIASWRNDPRRRRNRHIDRLARTDRRAGR